MNYYAHHIGDFIRDTARLSDAQCMAYLRMIWRYYETEQPLDGDVDALAFRIGATTSDVHQILKHYFFLHEGRWHNSRCDKEILAYRAKSNKAKKSAQARWSNANAMRTHETSGDANAYERTKTHEEDGSGAENKGSKGAEPMRTHSEKDAFATVSDANQEPRTKNHTSPSESKAPRKRSEPAIQRPEDVAEQTWVDWLALRKAKRAPVTSTVLDGARKEAELAGMPLDAFLQVWCIRGSQGLLADWLKPAERQVASRMQQTFRERDAEAGIRKWEELTGQRHPDRDRMGGQVIDTTSKALTLLETSL